MTAQAVKQRVAEMGVRSWEVWRAVCSHHPEHDYHIPPWQADDFHDTWIDAQLEALQHNLQEHPAPCLSELSWDELMQSAHELALHYPEQGYRPRHAARTWFQRR